MDELLDLELAQVASMLRRREISPVELATATLKRIDRLDQRLCAYITVIREAALESARTAEREIAANAYRGALHGVPIALKDVISTAGVRTTNGSRIFAESIPTTDEELGTVNVRRAKFHGEWNYTIRPTRKAKPELEK